METHISKRADNIVSPQDPVLRRGYGPRGGVPDMRTHEAAAAIRLQVPCLQGLARFEKASGTPGPGDKGRALRSAKTT
jgi:hypothetical protein